MEPAQLPDVEDVLVAETVTPERRTGDAVPLGVLRPDASGRDSVVVDLEERLAGGATRPLTRAERDAAKRDRGVPPVVFAPAYERVPKSPAPGDERFVRHPLEPDAS
jgi:hypothetical protein